MCHALMEAKTGEADERVARALDWLKTRQVLDVKGDWAEERPVHASDPHDPKCQYVLA